MKALTMIFSAFFIAGVASAGEQHGGQHGKPSNSSGAFSAAGAVAGSTAISGATGGQGGTGGAGGSAYISPMTFNFTTPTTPAGPSTSFVRHDYSGLPNNTPAMGNSYISTSNVCDGAVGITLALPGFGGGLSAAKLRMMCEGRLNAQAHKALGQEAKAKLTMEVVQEYACEEDATWAKIARKKGLCAPAEEAETVAQTNPAFNSK